MADTVTNKKPNLFAKAAGKAAAAPTKTKKKETIWALMPGLADTPTLEQLDKSVSEMHRLHAERKRLETEEGIHKSSLKGFAEERYVAHLANTGAEPESPLKIINSRNETVTFVVQDRGHLSKVSDEQVGALSELLGQDAVTELVFEAGEFKFDPLTMSLLAPNGTEGEPRTVQDVVAEALSEAISGLVTAGKLSQEQADGLLSFTSERRFKPQILSRAVSVCGRNNAKLASFLDILGSALTRYVKC
jgi:hypothetical protein